MGTVESFWTWLIWQIKLPSILVPLHTENSYLFDISESLSFLVIVRSAVSACWDLGIFLRQFLQTVLAEALNPSFPLWWCLWGGFSITYLTRQPQAPKFCLMSIHWFIRFFQAVSSHTSILWSSQVTVPCLLICIRSYKITQLYYITSFILFQFPFHSTL